MEYHLRLLVELKSSCLNPKKFIREKEKYLIGLKKL